MTSVEIFLAFSSPFCASSTNNKAPPIPFYPCSCSTTDCGKWNHISWHKNGALSLTQFPWKCSACLLCLGRWCKPSDNLSNDSLIKLVLKDLSTIHGNIVYQTYLNGSGVVKQWIEDEFVGSGEMIPDSWMHDNHVLQVPSPGAIPTRYRPCKMSYSVLSSFLLCWGLHFQD